MNNEDIPTMENPSMTEESRSTKPRNHQPLFSDSESDDDDIGIGIDVDIRKDKGKEKATDAVIKEDEEEEQDNDPFDPTHLFTSSPTHDDDEDPTTTILPSSLPLLPYHREILSEILLPPSISIPNPSQPPPQRQQLDKPDGLLIFSKGIGLRQAVLGCLAVYASSKYLVLLVNGESEIDGLREELSRLGIAELGDDGGCKYLKLVNTDISAEERVVLYRSGGVLAVTSRILVTDLLKGLVPMHLVTGLMILNAHKVTETSAEAFVIKLFREENKIGFIKAFSDSPESFTQGFNKLGKSLKYLHLRRLFLWPRFHFSVKKDLSVSTKQVPLTEVRIHLSESMKQIEAAIIECIDACLKELRKSHVGYLDDYYSVHGPDTNLALVDEEKKKKARDEILSVENAVFKSFDSLIRKVLDPVWHRVSSKTKLLVNDLKTLRIMLEYLLQYDCVTFNTYIENILAANNPTGPLLGGITNAAVRADQQSPWLLLDAADTIFRISRERVFKRITENEANSVSAFSAIPGNIEPVLEECPKWGVLKGVLNEIEEQKKELMKQGKPIGPTLILVNGDRTSRQLREYLSNWKKPKPKPKKRPARKELKRKRKGKGKGKGKEKVISLDSDEEDEAKGEPTETDGDMDDEDSQSDSDSDEEDCGRPLMMRLLERYYRFKQSMRKLTVNASAPAIGGNSFSTATNNTNNNTNNASSSTGFTVTTFKTSFSNNNTSNTGGSSSSGFSGRGRAPPAKRRRVRGGGNVNVSGTSRDASNPISSLGGTDITVEDVANFLDSTETIDATGESAATPAPTATHTDDFDVQDFDAYYGIIPRSDILIIRPYASTSSRGSRSEEDDSRILEELEPSWVIMYEPNMGFVRRMEVLKALKGDSWNLIRSYFLVYDGSIEEQKFLTVMRKENDSFQRLIREKSIMAIPIDQDGRILPDSDEVFWRNVNTRIAGGQSTNAVAPTGTNIKLNSVIVDIREFRSSLPFILHGKGMNLVPCTIEVGDYVLSPTMVVERKSVADLIGSFKNGRLYTQVDAMTIHYKTVILLIEFDQNKSFSLQASSELRSDISFHDIQSKLVLLNIAFPNLRIIWSSSPFATAEIFQDLKKQQEEPDMEKAMAIGVESTEQINTQYSITPSDVLQSLPGITSRNYRHVMHHVENLRELSNMSLEALVALLGTENGTKVHTFMKQNNS